MNAQLLSEFPGDASARAKFSNTPMPNREELLARNSAGGPDDNRFINAQLPAWKSQHEARGH